MMGDPKPGNSLGFVRMGVKLWKIYSGPGYPIDPKLELERGAVAWQQSAIREWAVSNTVLPIPWFSRVVPPAHSVFRLPVAADERLTNEIQVRTLPERIFYTVSMAEDLRQRRLDLIRRAAVGMNRILPPSQLPDHGCRPRRLSDQEWAAKIVSLWQLGDQDWLEEMLTCGPKSNRMAARRSYSIGRPAVRPFMRL